MREAWSSPTRTAARPGVMPLSARARTRSATSARICAAVALPSRIRAVTPESYRRTGPARSSVAEMTRPGEHDRHAVRLAGLPCRDPGRIDPRHLAGPDPHGRPVAREHDRVRLHTPGDPPGEEEVVP